ncbi:hypothetical protein Tco_0481061 [Tanacetum coccineum]
MRGTLLSSSILRIMKSVGKVNLPTSTSIFLTIPTGYWNDLSANLTLILVGESFVEITWNKKTSGVFEFRHSDQDIDKRFFVFIIAIEIDMSFRIGLLIIWVNCFGAFPSYEAKHRLEIHFHVEKKLGFLRGVGRKELIGFNESSSKHSFFVLVASFVEFRPAMLFASPVCDYGKQIFN